MKPPSPLCLDRLRRRDFEFIASVLAPEPSRDREALFLLLSHPDSLRQVLEEERLHRAILELAMPLKISPELYFYVLVRRALKEADIHAIGVAEYVAATMAQSAYGDLARSSALPLESDIDYHIDILQAIDRATPYERFFLQVRCGNRFMILTGLFPKFIRKRRQRRGAPGVRFYEEVARRAFVHASHHPLAEEFALAGVYQSLAEVLSDTRQALNHLADCYLFLDS